MHAYRHARAYTHTQFYFYQRQAHLSCYFVSGVVTGVHSLSANLSQISGNLAKGAKPKLLFALLHSEETRQLITFPRVTFTFVHCYHRQFQRKTRIITRTGAAQTNRQTISRRQDYHRKDRLSLQLFIPYILLQYHVILFTKCITVILIQRNENTCND